MTEMREIIANIKTGDDRQIVAVCDIVGKGPATYLKRYQEGSELGRDMTINIDNIRLFEEVQPIQEVTIQGTSYSYFDKPQIQTSKGGKICYAKRKNSNKLLTIKLYKPDAEEIAILQSIQQHSHPNLIPILGLTDINGIFHTAMPNMTCSIHEEIKTEGLPFDKAKWVSKEVYKGILFLHKECKVSHRNLNPKNILIQSDGVYRVVISDFSRATTSEDAATAPGAVGFTPPEVFEMLRKPSVIHKNNTRANDVYCFGATALAVFFGIPIFEKHLMAIENTNDKVLNYTTGTRGIYFDIDSLLRDFASCCAKYDDSADDKSKYLKQILPKCILYSYNDRSPISELFADTQLQPEKRKTRLFSFVPISAKASKNFEYEGRRVSIYNHHFTVDKFEASVAYCPGTTLCYRDIAEVADRFQEGFSLGGDIYFEKIDGKHISLPTRLVYGDCPGSIKYIDLMTDYPVSEFDAELGLRFFHIDERTTVAITTANSGNREFYAKFDIGSGEITQFSQIQEVDNIINRETYLRSCLLRSLPPPPIGDAHRGVEDELSTALKCFDGCSNLNIEKTLVRVLNGQDLRQPLESTRNYYGQLEIWHRSGRMHECKNTDIENAKTLREAIAFHIVHLRADCTSEEPIKRIVEWVQTHKESWKRLKNEYHRQEAWETMFRLMEWWNAIPAEISDIEAPVCAGLFFKVLPYDVLLPVYLFLLEKGIPRVVAEHKVRTEKITKYQRKVEDQLNKYFEEHPDNHLKIAKLFNLVDMLPNGYVGIKDENFKKLRETRICEVGFSEIVCAALPDNRENLLEEYQCVHEAGLLAVPFTTEKASKLYIRPVDDAAYLKCLMEGGSVRYFLVRKIKLKDNAQRELCLSRLKKSCKLQILGKYLDSCGLNITVNEANMTIIPLNGPSGLASEVYEIPDPSRTLPGHPSGAAAGIGILTKAAGIVEDDILHSKLFDQISYLPHKKPIAEGVTPYSLTDHEQEATNLLKDFLVAAAMKKVTQVDPENNFFQSESRR
eukprot:TRINITY_DN13108_c0_g2_i1.p1 TRINITY_DN13108_c0_g2~~TRINITY_DN13108_c0_g2_i1.p1  ORF type:complete len:1036 (+),score=158.33 TRINITY_DN13108_c0_g2_i1:75-3110(+)